MWEPQPLADGRTHLYVEGPEFPQGYTRQDKHVIISRDEESSKYLEPLLRLQGGPREPVYLGVKYTAGSLQSYRSKVDTQIPPQL